MLLSALLSPVVVELIDGLGIDTYRLEVLFDHRLRAYFSAFIPILSSSRAVLAFVALCILRVDLRLGSVQVAIDLIAIRVILLGVFVPV